MSSEFKILTLVGWEISKVKKDDKSRHPADILLPNGRYWFFKYWPEGNFKIDVLGYKRIPFLSFIEKRVLHFHLFQSLRILPRMRKYDLLIFFHSQVGIIPALFKSIFGLKTRLVVIDVEGLGRKNKWYILPLLKKAVSGIDRLFYLATIQREDYQKYFPKIMEKTHFLHLGLDPSRFSCNQAKEEDYIVSIGDQSSNFRDWKTLVRAYRQLKTKTKLLILGKERFQSIEIGYEEVPVGVEFVGKVDLSTLNEIISKARFVVLSLPERRHAFGQMTLLQGMAMRKAIIASRVSGVEDYVEDGKNAVFCEPQNWEDLKNKMEMLLRDEEMTNRIAKNARLSIEKQFNEKNMGENLYKAVAGLSKTDN